jgi:hypothetical protein
MNMELHTTDGEIVQVNSDCIGFRKQRDNSNGSLLLLTLKWPGQDSNLLLEVKESLEDIAYYEMNGFPKGSRMASKAIN